jgi:acetate kinase
MCSRTPCSSTTRPPSASAQLALFAPLHIGANLAGIAAAREVCPDVPHVAVFDTAFHRTLPEHAREYALPRSLAREHGIRRYGFHGTSHEYVSREAAHLLGQPIEQLNLITLHLGNGASVTAIRGGQSVDTSMGMTPLEGLVMGTRCGDVDPAVPLLIRELTDLSREDVHRVLNNESGLQGLCGERDMREVHKLADAGDPDAALALEMFCYRAKKYVGAYCAVLGSVDAVVFTAGIGENDPDVRARVCEGLELFGIVVDGRRNAASESGPRPISPDGMPTAVLVIPTDEEAEIARLTYACLKEE